MNNKYYLSINTTSLAHYIKKAIILPSRFYSNRPKDIQNLFEDYLLLSNIQFVNNSDCSIELILTEEEINNLKRLDNHIFLLNHPLPISRIKHIYFFTDEKKLLTIAKINDGAGFINENIVEISQNTNETVLNIEIPDIEHFSYSNEFVSKIKAFDHKLGGLAFGRFNTKNKYNVNYFSTLSYFNSYIKEEYEKNCIQKNSTSYEGFLKISGKWKELAPLIYETIEEKDVINSAEKEKITLLKNNVTGMFEFEKIDSKTNTYKLALLQTYGEDSTKRKSIDDLVSSILSDPQKYKIQEPISLIFGINNGYSVFYNRYKDKTVKFKMDSMLDYYTIESVFQYAINCNDNCSRFKYLDNIISKKSFIENLYFQTYTILDETVVTYNKTPISEMEDNVKSGVLGESLFDKIRIFIEKILKKKVEVERLLNQKKEENKILESKVQREQKKRGAQQEENFKLLQKVSETENQIEVLNKTIEDEQVKYSDLVKQKEEKTRILDNYRDKFTASEQHLETLNQELVLIKAKLEEKQKKNNELEVGLEILKDTFREQQSKIIFFEGQIAEASHGNKMALNGMRKHELLELAKQKGIQTSSRDTVQQLVDKLNENSSLL